MRLLFLIFLFSFFSFFFYVDESYAQSSNAITSLCPAQGLVNRVVNCVEIAVLNASSNFVQGFLRYIMPAVMAFITLGVVFFGGKMLTGAIRNISQELFILAIKIACIIFFVTNFDWFISDLIYASKELQETLLDYGGSSSLTNFGGASISEKCGNQKVEDLWVTMDCLLDNTFGFSLPIALNGGILALLIGMVGGGTIGLIILFIATFMLYMLFSTVLQAAMLYIICVMGIAFMSMISSLFIPLLLIKGTTSFFQQWLKLTVSFLMMPVILFAYIALVLATYDAIIFSGDHSLYRVIAGKNIDNPDFKMGVYLVDSGIVKKDSSSIMSIDLSSAKDKFKTIKDQGAIRTGVRELTGKELLEYDECESTPQDFKLCLTYYDIDFKKMSQMAGHNFTGSDDEIENQMIKKITVTMLIAAAIAYLMHGLMVQLPTITQNLLSGLKVDSSNFAIPGMSMLKNSITGVFK